MDTLTIVSEDIVSTVHKMSSLVSHITDKTDNLFESKQKYKSKKDKEVIEGWITLFYRIKILLLEEIDKLKSLLNY